MDELDKYRARYRRHWANNNRLKQSLALMGLTLDDAIEIELWLKLCGEEPIDWPVVEPKHS